MNHPFLHRYRNFIFHKILQKLCLSEAEDIESVCGKKFQDNR